MATEIIITHTRRYPTPAQIASGELELFAELGRDVPVGVPADADTWYEASLWQLGEGSEDAPAHLIMTRAGWFEREAIEALFVAINAAAIDGMLKSAKRARQ
jgi:hypothetical protein